MTDGNSAGGKVEDVISRRELTGMAEQLERRWLGEETDEQSLRELAAFFNRRLLEEEFADSETIPLEGEVENIYELLTADDVNVADAIQTRQRLSAMGIDPDELEEDFVSHQTIYRYLINFREVEKPNVPTPTAELIDSVHRTSTRSSNRIKAVTERNLRTLDDRDDVHVGDFDVYVDVRVSCSDCGTTRNISEFLDRRGCDCST